jgi:hypothetical protein
MNTNLITNKIFKIINPIVIALSFVQALPFLLLCVLCSPFIIFTYYIIKDNWFSAFLLRVLAKIYFFINGIYLQIDEKVASLPPSIIISNTQYLHETLLLWGSLSLKKIGLWPEERFKEYLRIARFLPREKFTIFDFSTTTFEAESYLEKNYGLFQTERFVYSKDAQIPFLLMLAAKNKRPVIIVDFENIENYPFASLFFPRLIKLKLVGKVEHNSDLKKMVSDYRALIKQFQE